MSTREKKPRLLWVMLREPSLTEGVPFRFVRLLPRIFGVEVIAVWSTSRGKEPT